MSGNLEDRLVVDKFSCSKTELLGLLAERDQEIAALRRTINEKSIQFKKAEDESRRIAESWRASEARFYEIRIILKAVLKARFDARPDISREESKAASEEQRLLHMIYALSFELTLE